MSEVAKMEGHAPFKPLIEDIHAAFTLVFPDEMLKTVEYQAQADGREVFTITSDKLARTYLRDVDKSFEELLRSVPHIDVSKVF
jgi:hypothetical protein